MYVGSSPAICSLGSSYAAPLRRGVVCLLFVPVAIFFLVKEDQYGLQSILDAALYNWLRFTAAFRQDVSFMRLFCQIKWRLAVFVYH